MNKSEIFSKAAKAFTKFGLLLKKHSPEILVGAGVVGTVTGTVLACRATRKIDTILDTANSHIKAVHFYEKNAEVEEYTKEDKTRDLTHIYVRTGFEFIKLYAVPAAVEVLSIISILAGTNVLRKRNMALAAAYLAVDKAFKNYRKNVVDRFGKEVDHELRYNIKAVQVPVTNPDGSPSTETKTIKVIDPKVSNDYIRYFDKNNPYWEGDSSYNECVLEGQQEHMNNLLKLRGMLYLNEVYEALGIPKSKAGQVVGWRYDEKNPTGDNYVDFRMQEVNRLIDPDNPDSGYESVWLLDFNVDGYIWNYMDDNEQLEGESL